MNIGLNDFDGARFSFNILPTKSSNITDQVQLGCLFTPLKEREDITPICKSPLQCNHCKAFINPYCKTDYNQRKFHCMLCWQDADLPSDYEPAKEGNPALLHYTVEYVDTESPILPIGILLVIDITITLEELKGVKQQLCQALNCMPDNTLVGVMTFGSKVYVHSLTNGLNQLTFDGTTGHSPSQVKDALYRGMTDHRNLLRNPYFMLAGDFIDHFQDLPAQEPPAQGKLAVRCTGAALSVAVGVLGSIFQNAGARIMLFIGGPCTQGPGLYSSRRDAANYYKNYYETLCVTARKNGHAIDVFAGARDVGLRQIRICCNLTGGHLVMADSFESTAFKETLKRIFAKNDKGECKMAFNALLEVKTSRYVKVCGAIGPCISTRLQGSNVSCNLLGIGGTSQWKFCALDADTTSAIFFEVDHKDTSFFSFFRWPSSKTPCPRGGDAYIQFITEYIHASGHKRIRVMTLKKNWVEAVDNFPYISGAIDEEAAAVLMGRLALFMIDDRRLPDRWLDISLINLCKRFGQNFDKESPLIFMGSNLGKYPELMFHLRRSQLFKEYNNSPERMWLFEHLFMRASTEVSCQMIVPTLQIYKLHGPAEFVEFDASSIPEDSVAMIDTFFQLIISPSPSISEWRNKPPNSDTKEKIDQLFRAQSEEQQKRVAMRFHVPLVMKTDEVSYGPQALNLISKLIPSEENLLKTNETKQVGLPDHGNFKNFWEVLMEKVF